MLQRCRVQREVWTPSSDRGGQSAREVRMLLVLQLPRRRRSVWRMPVPTIGPFLEGASMLWVGPIGTEYGFLEAMGTTRGESSRT
jgi:hypothetical protein